MKIEIEKPVIPQFVADWIEQLYGQGFNSDDLLEVLFSRNYEVAELRIFDWFTDDKGRAVTAILYGYEVEEEQKYYVMNEENELILGWSQSAYMTPCIEGYGYMKHNGRENLFQLTEQEIKDYDSRYWPFAVKIEEMEE